MKPDNNLPSPIDYSEFIKNSITLFKELFGMTKAEIKEFTVEGIVFTVKSRIITDVKYGGFKQEIAIDLSDRNVTIYYDSRKAHLITISGIVEQEAPKVYNLLRWILDNIKSLEQ